jgi:flagellar export protein FliJ
MNRKKHQRLNSVLQLAEVKENSAAAEFAKTKDSWEFNSSKLDELRAFRSEYQNPSSDVPYTPDRFQSTRQFLSQLSKAIDQQGQVDQMLSRMQADEAVWSGHRVKRKSIEKLLEKRSAEVQKQASRDEQNQLDEMSRPTTRL